MLAFVRIVVFAMRLQALPDTPLDGPTALEASAQMHAAARGPVTPALLAAITWRESRFTPSVFTHPTRRSWFCGVTQLKATSVKGCRALMARRFAVYADTVTHIDAWLRFCRVDKVARKHPDRLRCAIAGYGHGVKGARTGTTKNARAVLRLAARIASDRPLRRTRPTS